MTGKDGPALHSVRGGDVHRECEEKGRGTLERNTQCLTETERRSETAQKAACVRAPGNKVESTHRPDALFPVI